MVSGCPSPSVLTPVNSNAVFFFTSASWSTDIGFSEVELLRPFSLVLRLLAYIFFKEEMTRGLQNLVY